ncbi:MAG TPA: hypothetical protein VLG40_02960 [Candidatus Saccharimonas sp.]|nr:hypothetical protein [Candidatus Saccharimonas sp.]
MLDEYGQLTDEEIFFRLKDGEFVEVVDGELQFIGSVFPQNGMHMPYPNAGERLAFGRDLGKDGRTKACPWTLREAYDNRRRKLAEPYYRVTRVTRLGRHHSEQLNVIWEGQGADALSTEYPIQVLDGKLVDPLARSVHPDGYVATHYTFNVWVGHTAPEQGEGYWGEWMDPRPRADARELRGF